MQRVSRHRLSTTGRSESLRSTRRRSAARNGAPRPWGALPPTPWSALACSCPRRMAPWRTRGQKPSLYNSGTSKPTRTCRACAAAMSGPPSGLWTSSRAGAPSTTSACRVQPYSVATGRWPPTAPTLPSPRLVARRRRGKVAALLCAHGQPWRQPLLTTLARLAQLLCGTWRCGASSQGQAPPWRTARPWTARSSRHAQCHGSPRRMHCASWRGR
mmetsp:Transcript_10160/g.23431  ORF Transcript_10160/g.23431 Transcript_10160/m.23431 type:complete len:215 (-) Transcript_10160:1261-1905(-)